MNYNSLLINFSVKFSITKTLNSIAGLILRLGDRLALVPLIIIFAFVFAFEKTGNVNAQQQISKQDYKFQRQIAITGTSENVDFKEEVINSKIKNVDKINSISVEVESFKVPATPTPTPTPVVVLDDVWEKIAQCESKGNWSINTGNGYFGGLQFSQGAWNSVGGGGIPSEASKDEQITRGQMLQSVRGWGAWGDCAKKLNLL